MDKIEALNERRGRKEELTGRTVFERRNVEAESLELLGSHRA